MDEPRYVYACDICRKGIDAPSYSTNPDYAGWNLCPYCADQCDADWSGEEPPS